MKEVDPGTTGDRPHDPRSVGSAQWNAGPSAGPPIRIGKTAEEIIAILDEVASCLRPLPDRAALGSALQGQLGALTSALAASDPRAAMAALCVSRTLAIGYLSVVRPRSADAGDAANIMALVLNLEASETIVWQIERRERRSRELMRRFEKRPGSSGPQ
ncbi:MAG: hypothetical protein WEG36_00245 [Gemmatimonadota bacterium]